MKTRLSLLLICLSLLAFSTGCSLLQKGSDSPATEPPQVSLADIAAANTMSTRLNENQIMTIATMLYTADGTLDSNATAQVARTAAGYRELYVDSFDLTTYFDGTAEYGQLQGHEQPAFFCIPEQALAEKIAGIETQLYEHWESEAIVSTELAGGLLTLTTETPVGKDTQAVEDMLGQYDFVKLRTVYQLDPDTLAIARITIYTVDQTGAALLSAEWTVRVEDGSLTPPGFVTEMQAATEQRTCTLVTDPGTQQEKTFTFTFAKNAIFGIYFPTGYQVFQDPEGKVPMTELSADGSDAIAYLIPAAKGGDLSAFTLGRVAARNTVNHLTGENQTLTVTTDYYDVDGSPMYSETSQNFYKDGAQQNIFWDQNGFQEFYDGTARYQLYPGETPRYVTVVMLPEDISDFVEYLRTQQVFYASPNETIMGLTAKDGQVYLTTEIPGTSPDAEALHSALGLDQVAAYQFAYRMDQESMAIDTITIRPILDDGTQWEAIRIQVSLQKGVPSVPAYAAHLKSPENTRTCTLVRDPGLDSEISHTFPIAHDSYFSYYIPAGYSAYWDAAGTRPVVKWESGLGNTTVYLIADPASDS